MLLKKRKKFCTVKLLYLKERKNSTSRKMTYEKDFCTWKKTMLENVDVPKRKKVWT